MIVTNPYLGVYTKEYRQRLLMHARLFGSQIAMNAVNINDTLRVQKRIEKAKEKRDAARQ